MRPDSVWIDINLYDARRCKINVDLSRFSVDGN